MNILLLRGKEREMKVRTHYCAVIKPDAHNPTVIGYNVWAWIGHPLLGEIQGTHVFVKTKGQAQRMGRKIRMSLDNE